MSHTRNIPQTLGLSLFANDMFDSDPASIVDKNTSDSPATATVQYLHARGQVEPIEEKYSGDDFWTC